MNKINRLRNQSGIAIVPFVFVLVVVGFFFLVGLRLVPIYLQSFEISSIVNQVGQELSGSRSSPNEIYQAIERRFDVNGITRVGREDIRLTQRRGGISILLAYEVRVPLFFNLDMVASFREEALVSQ